MSEEEVDIWTHQHGEWLARRQKDLAASLIWYREFFGEQTFLDVDNGWKARSWTRNGPSAEAS